MEVKQLRNLYIAHRGIQTKDTIENTPEAFALAIQKQVPIELDIHILKDDSIVVFHDDNLKRLFGMDKKIEDYTYSELKEIAFPNTNISIPLLIDVLEKIKGKVLVIIEIKTTSYSHLKKYYQQVLSILKNYPYDFVIQSFDIRIVHYFLKYTNYITGLLIANRKNSFYDNWMQKKITLSLLKPDFISVDQNIVQKRFVQQFRKQNPVLVWTIHNSLQLNQVKPYADSYIMQDFYF